MQEIHSTIENEIEWTAEWGGDIIFLHGSSKARGVCILLPKNMKLNLNKVQKDDSGHWIIVSFTEAEQDIAISNLYAPNQDHPAFFRDVFKQCESYSEKLIIIWQLQSSNECNT